MNIQQLRSIISRYLDGKADMKETRLIEEWSNEALDEARQVPDTDQFADRRKAVLLQLRQVMEPVREAKLVKLRRARAIAAAGIVLLGGSLTAYLYRYPLLDMIDPVEEQRVVAQQYQVREVKLPDSSVVVLNGGAEIVYPKRFRGPGRNVQLNGEAFFRITADPQAAFVVHASHLQVKVLGTSFVVADGPDADAARVSVKTGKVAVSTHDHGFATAQLSADQELIFNRTDGSVHIDRHKETNMGWINKQLVFSASPLSIVIGEIERTFNVQIRLADPAIGKQLFTGAFEAEDKVPDILKIIAASYGLTVAESGKDVFIIR